MRHRILRLVRYTAACLGHYTGIDAVFRKVRGPGVVILMMHRLRDEHDPYPLSLSNQTMHRLVGWLKKDNLLVDFDTALKYLDNPGNSRATPYTITFDDGYRDNLGLLDKQLDGAPALIYIATDQIDGEPIWAYRLSNAIEHRQNDLLDLGQLGLGRFDLSTQCDCQRALAQIPARLKQLAHDDLQQWVEYIVQSVKPKTLPQREMLNWEEVKTLSSSNITIGAHTKTHVLLSKVNEDMATTEIVGSRERITEELGNTPKHFAYPNGGRNDFGTRDVELVRKAGFASATTSIEGINRKHTDRYQLLRFNVHESRFVSPFGKLSPALFYSETNGLLEWLRFWRNR